MMGSKEYLRSSYFYGTVNIFVSLASESSS